MRQHIFRSFCLCPRAIAETVSLLLTAHLVLFRSLFVPLLFIHNSKKQNKTFCPFTYLKLCVSLSFPNLHRLFSLSPMLPVKDDLNLCDLVDSESIKCIFASCPTLCSLVCLNLSLRVTTGSCLPPHSRWRRWARQMRERTLAWPSIPPWRHSTRNAPSASPCCPVRREIPEHLLLSFILAKSRRLLPLPLSEKLVSENNVPLPLTSTNQKRSQVH